MGSAAHHACPPALPLASLGIHLTGDLTTGGTVDIPGETDFAFLVPEPAFEDVYLISSLASKK